MRNLWGLVVVIGNLHTESLIKIGQAKGICYQNRVRLIALKIANKEINEDTPGMDHNGFFDC